MVMGFNDPPDEFGATGAEKQAYGELGYRSPETDPVRQRQAYFERGAPSPRPSGRGGSPRSTAVLLAHAIPPAAVAVVAVALLMPIALSAETDAEIRNVSSTETTVECDVYVSGSYSDRALRLVLLNAQTGSERSVGVGAGERHVLFSGLDSGATFKLSIRLGLSHLTDKTVRTVSGEEEPAPGQLTGKVSGLRLIDDGSSYCIEYSVILSEAAGVDVTVVDQAGALIASKHQTTASADYRNSLGGATGATVTVASDGRVLDTAHVSVAVPSASVRISGLRTDGFDYTVAMDRGGLSYAIRAYGPNGEVHSAEGSGIEFSGHVGGLSPGTSYTVEVVYEGRTVGSASATTPAPLGASIAVTEVGGTSLTYSVSLDRRSDFTLELRGAGGAVIRSDAYRDVDYASVSAGGLAGFTEYVIAVVSGGADIASRTVTTLGHPEASISVTSAGETELSYEVVLNAPADFVVEVRDASGAVVHSDQVLNSSHASLSATGLEGGAVYTITVVIDGTPVGSVSASTLPRLTGSVAVVYAENGRAVYTVSLSSVASVDVSLTCGPEEVDVQSGSGSSLSFESFVKDSQQETYVITVVHEGRLLTAGAFRFVRNEVHMSPVDVNGTSFRLESEQVGGSDREYYIRVTDPSGAEVKRFVGITGSYSASVTGLSPSTGYEVEAYSVYGHSERVGYKFVTTASVDLSIDRLTASELQYTLDVGSLECRVKAFIDHLSGQQPIYNYPSTGGHATGRFSDTIYMKIFSAAKLKFVVYDGAGADICNRTFSIPAPLYLEAGESTDTSISFTVHNDYGGLFNVSVRKSNGEVAFVADGLGPEDHYTVSGLEPATRYIVNVSLLDQDVSAELTTAVPTSISVDYLRFEDVYGGAGIGGSITLAGFNPEYEAADAAASLFLEVTDAAGKVHRREMRIEEGTHAFPTYHLAPGDSARLLWSYGGAQEYLKYNGSSVFHPAYAAAAKVLGQYRIVYADLPGGVQGWRVASLDGSEIYVQGVGSDGLLGTAVGAERFVVYVTYVQPDGSYAEKRVYTIQR